MTTLILIIAYILVLVLIWLFIYGATRKDDD